MLKENFIRYLEVERRFSPRTVRLYEEAVTEFYAFLEEDDIQPGAMTPQNVRSFIAHGLDTGLGARTMNLKLSALSTWCGWLLRQGLLEESGQGELPTRIGRVLGIRAEERGGINGPYTVVLYGRSAQRYILDHLDEIVGKNAT